VDHWHLFNIILIIILSSGRVIDPEPNRIQLFKHFHIISKEMFTKLFIFLRDVINSFVKHGTIKKFVILIVEDIQHQSGETVGRSLSINTDSFPNSFFKENYSLSDILDIVVVKRSGASNQIDHIGVESSPAFNYLNKNYTFFKHFLGNYFIQSFGIFIGQVKNNRLRLKCSLRFSFNEIRVAHHFDYNFTSFLFSFYC
jgi:hypothetical protein